MSETLSIPVDWTCLPPMGCECSILRPFVEYLNGRGNTSFEVIECLHRTQRNAPAPEAMYRDAETGRQLVIERKNLVWPADHVELHSTDHEIAGGVLAKLGSRFGSGLYLLELPDGIRAGKRERAALIERVAHDILQQREAVEAGYVTGEDEPIRWCFTRQEPDERDPWEAQDGVEVRFKKGSIFNIATKFSSETLPAIERRLHDLMGQAECKFRPYSGAASILLLACYTEAFVDLDSVRSMVQSCQPTPTIGEIWLAGPDWDGFEVEPWYALLSKQRAV